jgi:hypothetical protein
MHSQRQHQRSDLVRIATHVMAERGLEPEFSRRVEQQLAAITGPGRDDGPDVHDLTHLLWCSIDNDDSLDLDQLTVCEPLPSGAIRLWVAIADVDALVKKDTPIDAHALLNTTSVYTSARIFPMLPERLCTDLTSLNPARGPAGPGDRDGVQCRRLAGRLHRVPRAGAQPGQAGLRRGGSAWIDGEADLPDAAAAVPGMEAQLRTQDALAQQLRARRHALGSLDLETFQPRAAVRGRASGGHPPAGAEPRAPADRGGDDRHQRLHGALSGRSRAAPRCGGWCARPSAGCASWGWPRTTARSCRTSRIRKALEAFLARSTGSTRCAFPTCRWSSSSSWGVDAAGQAVDLAPSR